MKRKWNERENTQTNKQRRKKKKKTTNENPTASDYNVKKIEWKKAVTETAQSTPLYYFFVFKYSPIFLLFIVFSEILRSFKMTFSS